MEAALVRATSLGKVGKGTPDGRGVYDKVVCLLPAAVPAAILLRGIAEFRESLGNVEVHLTRGHNCLVLRIKVDCRVVAHGAMVGTGRGSARVVVSVQVSSHFSNQSRAMSRISH